MLINGMDNGLAIAREQYVSQEDMPFVSLWLRGLATDDSTINVLYVQVH